jgi:S-formylglutathione hydrolase FrmB
MNRIERTSQVSIETVSLYSRLNKRELPYCVVLPDGYESSKGKYAVLYLLHGLFGRFDNWITNTKLTEYAENFSFIIVCAEGENGWWTDSTEIEGNFYESYLTEELIPDVERKFNVRAERNSRAIAGLSMGGYGAFKLAFRRPEMFCFAASTSGAFHAAEICENRHHDEWRELLPSISQVFGDADNKKNRRENDLFQLVRDFPSEQISRLPRFYFDCGTEDSFLPVNLRLAELFRQLKIAHEFQSFSGAHDWNYWDEQMKRILFVAEKFLTAYQ